jgi:F-type H+-transporting ATPase subunit b
MEILKLLSANEIVAQVIAFFLVLWLLKHFMWGRLLKLLDDRKERIASEFDTIEKEIAEAARIKAEYEAKRAAVGEEGLGIIEQAKEDGEKAAEQIRKAAQVQAQEIIEKAKSNAQYELTKAKQTLKDELVDITIKAAEDIIEEKLTEQQDRNIVEDFLKRMDTLEDD